MSRANSSKGLRRAFATLTLASLAACAQQNTTTAEATAKPAGDGRVGYVRMEDLVKVHPLYSQLARLDEDMQALQLRSVGTEIARSGADIEKAEHELQAELNAAADRTKKALTDKQLEYAKREQAAINAALGGAAGATGPGGGAIASGVAAQARSQAQSAAGAAQHNLDVYRQQLIAQDESAVRSLDAALGERASRTYRARADELQKNEADFSLQQANDDAAERLSLRAKLSNLALDDTSRADVKKQLDALDQKEGDALAAMRNRDQATLADFQTQLHERVRTELNAQIAEMRKRTVAKIGEREDQTRKQLIAQIGLPPQGGTGGSSTVGLSPDMRAKLEALHRKYQTDFNKDASQTVAQFQKTRADLTKRFQQLSGVDSDAQAGAGKQLGALQKQRGELYEEMVSQIGREVKVIAQKRGIDVVVSDVVAPAGGVDLTADAEKDVESLHE
jgi:hypothetical protein